MRGLEPRTPCLQSRYSNRLSYIPIYWYLGGLARTRTWDLVIISDAL